MAPGLKMTIPKDFTKIDVNNLGELIWWSARLGVGPEKLLKTIGKVGIKMDVIKSDIRLH